MAEPRKYVIIIGAMKSGTTTLFDVLARHPRIAPARNKEPGFFAFEPIWSKGFDWFDTLFDFDPDQHVYRLEASTDYTKAPFVTGVWERMTARADVDLRLLYIMRHPLRRIESHARHVQAARKEIGQQISPKSDHGLDAGLSLLNLAVSRYAYQLDAYAAARSQGKLHCLTLEDLKAHPDTTLAAVWDFLELDPPDDSALPRSNAAGPRQSVHPLWAQMVRMRPLMALGKGVLPKGLRTTIKGLFLRRVTAEGRFKLTPAETAMLATLYEDDIERLRTVYNAGPKTPWDLR